MKMRWCGAAACAYLLSISIAFSGTVLNPLQTLRGAIGTMGPNLTNAFNNAEALASQIESLNANQSSLTLSDQSSTNNVFNSYFAAIMTLRTELINESHSPAFTDPDVNSSENAASGFSNSMQAYFNALASGTYIEDEEIIEELEKMPRLMGALEELEEELIEQAKEHQEQVDSQEAQGNVIAFANRFRQNRNRTPVAQPPVAAGEFTNLRLSLDISYASIDDDRLHGNGHDRNISSTLSGVLDNDYHFGVSISHNSYDLNGFFKTERHTNTLELFVNYIISDRVSAGAFINYSQIDIESHLITLPLSGTLDLGDTYERWSLGLMGNANIDVGSWNWGATAVLASTNKRRLGHIFNSTDSLFLLMIDGYTNWTDTIATDVFGTYVTSLRNEHGLDSSYYMLGFDVIWTPSENWEYRFGYEQTVGYTDFSDHRFNFSVAYLF